MRAKFLRKEVMSVERTSLWGWLQRGTASPISTYAVKGATHVALQDCIKFANDHPVCYVATMDGDQLRVREFLMFFADDTGFYFAMPSPKQVSKQLKQNPKTEICFYNNPAELQDA